MVSDTYQRVELLINDASSRDKPVFTRQLFFNMEKRNHGMHAGGGDWNGDGVFDFLHMPFAGGQFKVFPGKEFGKTGLKFEEGGLKAAKVLPVPKERALKARKCAWAWDFSGTARKRGVIEYVGITKANNEIALFEYANGTSRLLKVLHVPDMRTPLCTAGDLNRDGRMDILFSGGLWNNEQQKTSIYVMYGKVLNSPDTALKREMEDKQENTEGKTSPVPEPESRIIDIPEGCSAIELKDGPTLIVRSFTFNGPRVEYVTPDGKSGSLSFREVKRIRRK